MPRELVKTPNDLFFRFGDQSVVELIIKAASPASSRQLALHQAIHTPAAHYVKPSHQGIDRQGRISNRDSWELLSYVR